MVEIVFIPVLGVGFFFLFVCFFGTRTKPLWWVLVCFCCCCFPMQEKPWIILGLFGASLALTATALVTVVILH